MTLFSFLSLLSFTADVSTSYSWGYSKTESASVTPPKLLLLSQWFQSLMCAFCVLCHVSLFVTPWTLAHQVLLSIGYSRQEYWSGLPCPFLGHLPDPGMEPRSPALQVDSLPSEPPGKSRRQITLYVIIYIVTNLKKSFVTDICVCT